MKKENYAKKREMLGISIILYIYIYIYIYIYKYTHIYILDTANFDKSYCQNLQRLSKSWLIVDYGSFTLEPKHDLDLNLLRLLMMWTDLFQNLMKFSFLIENTDILELANFDHASCQNLQSLGKSLLNLD